MVQVRKSWYRFHVRTASSLSFLVLGGILSGFACSSESLPTGCPEGTRYFRGQCLIGHEVRLNSVGYLPERAKFASFQGTSPGFVLKDAESGDVVYSGTAQGPTRNRDTNEQLYRADFSDFDDEGRYFVEIEAGRSAVFEIGQTSLDHALDAVMLGLYGQRCGEAVNFQYGELSYFHQQCHMQDASLARVGEGSRGDTGGWHDAGDYGKYTRNGAFAVSFLVRAYEQFPEFLEGRAFDIPETGDAVPDILDEARVELEWLLKVQFDDGSFSHKVTAENFEVDIMPEADNQPRFFVSASSTSTANAVAALAQAARVYEPFDAAFAEKCLAAARRGQEFLGANPEPLSAIQDDINTGNYGCATSSCTDQDQDERLWALAELWETTGEEAFLEELEVKVRAASVRANFDWADVENLGLCTYALSDRPGRDPDLVAEVQFELQRIARFIADNSQDHGYGRGFEYYYWGANGSIARLSYNLIAAHRLAPDAGLLDVLTAQLDHLLGHNAYSRSFVTGLGADPVMRPHHRPSIADANFEPWPGLLIGGPHAQGQSDPLAQDYPALAWTDEAANYWHNEIAINWSTAMAYALVAALATRGDETAACQPDCLVDPGVGGAGGQSPGE